MPDPRIDQIRSAWMPAAVLLMGVLIRLDGIGKEALWYDELYSATHASVSVLQVPASVRAFDMHPPLYYLQLAAWEKLGSSDVWLRLNSTLWWLLAGISLFYVAKRTTSQNVALLTIVLYTLNPAGVHLAHELRMYSLLAFLSIWCFYLSQRLLSDEASLASSVLLLATTITVIYTHGAGFLILVCMWTQATWMMLRRQISAGSAGRFALVQGLAVLAGVPEHVRAASMHQLGGLSYAIAPSMEELIRQSSWLYSGRGAAFGPWTTLVTLLFVAPPLLLACRTASPARRAVLFYVGVPIAACCAISHISHPIWVFRVISYTVPFCCFGLADGTMRLERLPTPGSRRMMGNVLKAGCMGALVVYFAFAIYCQRNVYPRVSDYHAVVQHVRLNALDQDVVFVPQRFSYWAFCWYFVQPGAVNPLSDAGIQKTDKGRIVARMSPLEDSARTLLAGCDQHDQSTRTIWLLIRGHRQAEKMLSEILARGELSPRLVTQVGELHVCELRPKRA